MRTLFAASRLLLLMALSLLSSSGQQLYGKQRYSQIVVPFPDERVFTYRYEPSERALVLEIQGTHTSELEPVFHYDETVVRRVFFKDQGGQGTEVKLILRDDSVRVMVNSFHEPFRITVDFFDADYKETHDPTTGLPLVPVAQGSADDDRPTLAETAPGSVPAAETGSALAEPAGKRRLLQPQPEAIRTPQELVVKLNDTAGGLGQSWKTYPPYIYRIQIATFKTGKSYEGWIKQNAGKAMTSTDAMAQYAGQLFDFGHENRALIAYQKVLHQDPTVFDRGAEHIWKLAEIHLGQGNLTLADGYYESLQQKHPDSPLSSFGAMRRLDIKSIRAIQQGKAQDMANLSKSLEAIPTRDNHSLTALAALRRAYWQIEVAAIQKLMPHFAEPPVVGPNIMMRLEESRAGSDSPRTAFLIDSIILANRLKSEVWNAETAKIAGEYFERYKGKATEPFRPLLMKRCEASILTSIDKHLKAQEYADVVSVVESLPKSADELRKATSVSWAAAESYRRMKQPVASLPYYENAARTTDSKPDQFRAWFWHMQASMKGLDNETARKSGKDTLDRLNKGLQTSDRNAWESWKTLTAEEKTTIHAEIKADLEANLTAPQLVRTSPRILLETWNQKLATETPTAGAAVGGSRAEGQPTARMIYLFADLSKRFEQLSMDPERQAAKQLLRKINLKSAPPDKDALRVWTNELTALAEEFRRNNDYLEAGRLYTQTGTENNQWEGRAEALYKGGLLLYRSGRRDEAMAAFKQAADDGNNLLYAELAKKRLEQIQR
ncbi:MAG TPA: tetratricopeptide repeat protein [Oligoflexus sp.]|uniref:tetratricopeptide repeat protein n=1 Tax=Oligoflexus sp. TaxID=1971216 RepID=UPI002D6C3E33|nr:tetratricopeptide repeat protein [Oligoflexus sp.]HYX33641.1 tetratricopeptide repeat protein [Oligoflexus sp.]